VTPFSRESMYLPPGRDGRSRRPRGAVPGCGRCWDRRSRSPCHCSSRRGRLLAVAGVSVEAQARVLHAARASAFARVRVGAATPDFVEAESFEAEHDGSAAQPEVLKPEQFGDKPCRGLAIVGAYPKYQSDHTPVRGSPCETARRLLLSSPAAEPACQGRRRWWRRSSAFRGRLAPRGVEQGGCVGVHVVVSAAVGATFGRDWQHSVQMP
jgi:hypothetical protein